MKFSSTNKTNKNTVSILKDCIQFLAHIENHTSIYVMCSSSQVNLEDALLGSPGNSVVPKNKITVSVLMDYMQFLSQLENRMNVCDVFVQLGEFRGHFPWFSMKFSSTKKQNHCQCSDGLHTVLGSHGKSYKHICDVHPAMKLSEACI